MEMRDKIRDVLKEKYEINEDVSLRVDQMIECLDSGKSLHTLSYVEQWFEKQKLDCTMQLEEIGLKDLERWHIDEESKNVSHESGEFFSVIGIRVTNTSKREVNGWTQPMVAQKQDGILGILRKKINGIYHYLLHAKAEPGNIHKLQLSPTLQATRSNLKKAHAGKKPKFAEYFESEELSKVVYSRNFAEDGGRFYLKTNQNMIVEVSEDVKLDIPDDYIWVTMYQIKQLLKKDNLIAPHVRGIISVL